MEIEKIEKIGDLKQGYYGHVYGRGTAPDGRSLYEINIASQDDDGWELGEWYLVDGNMQAECVAHCDGYSGIEWRVEIDEMSDEMSEYLTNTVASYNICGLLDDCIEASLDDADDDIDDDDNNGGDGWMIFVSPCYYEGTLRAQGKHFLSDDCASDDSRRVFATIGEARAWIDEENDKQYCIANGEAGRPDYAIVRAV